MPAHEHLNRRLFHGTSAQLNIGDSINPGRGDAHYGDADWEHGRPDLKGIGAYATTSREDAEKYAAHAYSTERQDTLDSGKPFQERMFNPVYEVEHKSEHSDPLNILPAPYARDMKGFKVKGVHLSPNLGSTEYVPSQPKVTEEDRPPVRDSLL